MSAAEKDAYLKTMFNEDESDSNGLSDSDDEDWVPQSISNLPVSDSDSDNECTQSAGDTEGNVLEHAEEEKADESENSESENDDEVGSAEPTGSTYFFADYNRNNNFCLQILNLYCNKYKF